MAFPRLLGMLEKHGIRSTFFVPGYTAHRYPEVVRNIVAAGHEVAHHGYLHEQPTGVSASEEANNLDRGLRALEEVAGIRPVGYRAPMWDLSWRSPALLEERGFLYDSSLMDADVPYELSVTPGAPTSIVEIPIQWALDDWEQYCYLPDISGTGLIETPRKARELWQQEFEGLRSVGGCWVLTNHPFLSGRPSRAHQLDELMAHVSSCDDVWTASLEEIARHVRSQGLPATQHRVSGRPHLSRVCWSRPSPTPAHSAPAEASEPASPASRCSTLRPGSAPALRSRLPQDRP